MLVQNLYLEYITKEEAQEIMPTMPFLTRGGGEGKESLVSMVNNIYDKSMGLKADWCNGRYPDEYCAEQGDKLYYTLIEFSAEDMTEDAIKMFGKPTNEYFPYYYAIMLGRDDRRLYVASFIDNGVPNWNTEYKIKRVESFENVTIPLIKDGCVFYKIDDALHREVNRIRYQSIPVFSETPGNVQMTVRDQHGHYKNIKGATIEEVFRDYADNYTGYQSFRRPRASEYIICDANARNRFDDWKMKAKGLKSDFDKFYGNAVVD